MCRFYLWGIIAAKLCCLSVDNFLMFSFPRRINQGWWLEQPNYFSQLNLRANFGAHKENDSTSYSGCVGFIKHSESMKRSLENNLLIHNSQAATADHVNTFAPKVISGINKLPQRLTFQFHNANRDTKKRSRHRIQLRLKTTSFGWITGSYEVSLLNIKLPSFIFPRLKYHFVHGYV